MQLTILRNLAYVLSLNLLQAFQAPVRLSDLIRIYQKLCFSLGMRNDKSNNDSFEVSRK
jgi:hypothetical protein